MQSRYTFPNNPLVNGYVIRAGDRIYLRQENYGVAKAGIIIKFTNGASTLNNTYDQSGYALNCDQLVASWHLRYADLSAHAGKTIQDVQIVNDACSAAGAFWATFTDIAIASTDGAVRPIYNRQKAMSLSVSCDTGVTDCWQIVGHPTNVGWAHFSTTTYYHGDHLGSSRFLSSYNGTPMWEATYLPFGQEWNPPSGSGPVSPNHYKFTGKERDGESGLDYFGARFYASAQGRFLSADLPFADQKPEAPQSWNLYSYVRNNPIVYVDTNGRFLTPDHELIIDQVFTFLTEKERNVLKFWSAWVDRDQSPEGSYKHAMSHAGQGDGSQEALDLADWWIGHNLDVAVALEVSAQMRGDKETHLVALGYFAKALHTVTDKASRAHAGSMSRL